MRRRFKLAFAICVFAAFLFAMALSGCALESTDDYQIYYPNDLKEIMRTDGNISVMESNDGGIPAIRVMNDGVENPTSEYVIFNFGSPEIAEKDYVPAFPIKKYPFVVISYKTEMNAGSLSINVGMKVDDQNAYKRVWGLRNYEFNTDGQYHKLIYNLTGISSYDGGSATWDNITEDSGAKYVRIPAWAHSNNQANAKGESLNIEYIGFFKDESSAKDFGRKDGEKLTYVDVKYIADGKIVREESIAKGGVIYPLDAPSRQVKKFTGWKTPNGDHVSAGTKVEAALTLTAEYEADASAVPAIVDNSKLHGFHSTHIDVNMFTSEKFDVASERVTDDVTGKTFVRFTGSVDSKSYNRAALNLRINTKSYFDVREYPYVAISYRSNFGGSGDSKIKVGLKYKDKYSSFENVTAKLEHNGEINKAVYDIRNLKTGDAGVSFDYVDWDSSVSFIELYPFTEGTVKFTGKEYFDIEYVAFFKTKAEADAFTYTGSAAFETAAERHDIPFIAGYEGYKFKPDNNMTRAEACTVITRMLIDEKNLSNLQLETKFTDLEKGAWYYNYVAYLEGSEYLKSYSGKFEPNKPITRAEFVELVYAMGTVKADPDNKPVFSDVPATHPRYDVIMAGASAGLVSGRPGGVFDPDGTIKRSEVVKVLCSALGRKPSAESFEDFIVLGFVDVEKTHWAYPYIIEAAYEHITVFDKDKNETWVTFIDANDYIKEMPDGLIEELDKKFAERVAKIRASESEYTLEQGRRIIYVSNDGDDNNNGRSPEKAIKTLAEVERKIKIGSIKSGDVVLLRRGDEWHHQLTLGAGITLSAYGEGDKPRILGSIEADNASQWIKTDANNVYKFDQVLDTTQDMGNIVFNNGEAYGMRIIKSNAGNYTLTVGWNDLVSNGKDFWKFPVQPFAGYKDLAKIGAEIPEADLMFYHDRENSALYLYCEAGNPGDVFDSIELCRKGHAIRAASNNITVDNILFGYTGSHGLSAGSLKNLTVRNCEVCWIGGSVQGEDVNTRFGNAVEIYGQADGYYVYDNFMYQCFDCGPTVQVGTTLTEGKQIYQKNIAFYGNALAEASLEIWLSTTPKNTETTFAKLINCRMYDNYVTMSGYGWKAYNHQKNDYCSFYGAGDSGAEYIDCYMEDNYFWNIKRNLLKATDTNTRPGLGFHWRNNVIIKTLGSDFAHMGSNLEEGSGFKVYPSYDEETIRLMLTTGAFGLNSFYYLPDDYGYETYLGANYGNRP